MIREAFAEWSENPVVTTMDSIAAPITNIQFPTVTLCNDEKKIPDSWAFLEKILSFVSFICPEGSYDRCQSTRKIRDDLKFLVEPIAKDFKVWFFQNKKNITNAPLLMWQWCIFGVGDNHDSYSKKCPEGLRVNYLAQMMKERKLSDKELYDLSITSLGRIDRELGELIEREIGIKLPEYQEDDPYCKSKRCKGNIRRLNVYLQLLALIKSGQAPELGTSLKMLTKMDRKSANDDYPSFKSSDFFDEDFSCYKGENQLKENELWLHQYLTNLSKVVGFEDKELVSLYDVPGMVSKLTIRQIEDLFGPQNFIYSRCKDDEYFQPIKIVDCFNTWNVHLHNSGKIMTSYIIF